MSYEIYNCVAGEVRTSFMNVNAIIVTGAPRPAYDTDPWIGKLRMVFQGMFLLRTFCSKAELLGH
jgi:hypothetical protein